MSDAWIRFTIEIPEGNDFYRMMLHLSESGFVSLPGAGEIMVRPTDESVASFERVVREVG